MRLVWLAALSLTVACNGNGKDTTGDTAATTGTTDPSGTTNTQPARGDWCQVQTVFNGRCVLCHSPSNLQGGLDLQTDPLAAIVGVDSAEFPGNTLVASGDPEGSLLYRKMTGTQAGDEGEMMPTTGLAPEPQQQIVREWIEDGATDVCGAVTTGTTPTGNAYHPAGWADPGVHGLGAKLQTETDCRDCHGSDLSGGTSSVACSSCHQAGWETNCTYCHGGVSDNTGAPPEDIDDNANPSSITFPPHHEHVQGTRHPDYGCDTCHHEPSDVLTPGHLFDDATAGQAEVDVSGGLANGSFSGNSCTVYCHGNGRGSNGTVSINDGPRTCESCHTTNGLGGEHGEHLREGVDCQECHPDVDNVGISVPDQHVDGTKQVDPAGSITWDAANGTCSGTCHFEGHSNRHWN
ncbi:MAG: c-type cytochrome domain-containing protein [Myxococcota bacterium]